MNLKYLRYTLCKKVLLVFCTSFQLILIKKFLFPNLNYCYAKHVGFLYNKSAPFNWRHYEKPMYYFPYVSKDVLKKKVFLDYENILRSHDPSFINYNTRLSSIPGIDIYSIDNIYGRIYDRKVLLKQIDYFLRQDDFHTIYRMLRDNPKVLNRTDCRNIMRSFPYFIRKVLKYPIIQLDKAEEQLRFVLGRYVLQHVVYQIPLETSKYRNLVDGEVPGYPVTEDSEKDPNRDKIPVEEHPAYIDLMNRYAHVPPEVKFEKARILQERMIESKHKKLSRALWNFQDLKPAKHLSTRIKYKNYVNLSRINPLIARPLRYTQEQFKQANEDFATAVEKEDIVTACYILLKQTRLLDFRDKPDLLRKFMTLNKRIHQSGKYPAASLKNIRLLYYRTVKTYRVLLKLREYRVLQDIFMTPKELYDREINAYRERRDKAREEKMKAAGFDVERLKDFSNAYSEDWVPVLRPEEFKKAAEFAKKRVETIQRIYQDEVEEDLLESYGK